MKIEQREIAKELKKLKSITPNSKITETNGVLFSKNMLVANNLEITITAKLDVETDEMFIIPLKAIDYIESLPAGLITITLDRNRLHIKSNFGESSFSTFDVNDFPQFNNIDYQSKEAGLRYDGAALADAINSVLYACSDNSLKPVMTGVLLQGDGDHLNIVGCDGYRLAWNQIDYKGELEVVVPKSTIQKVLSLGLQGGIELYDIDNKKAVFKTDKYTVYTRLLEGKYINYSEFFEEDGYDTKASVKRMDLLESVSRSVICSGDKINAKTILENTEDGNLSINTKSDIAEFQETVNTFSKIKNGMKIAFNPKLLIESLKASDEDNIDIFYKDSLKAVWLFDGNIKQLVLPVRL